jgi:hypothetical protein
MEKVEEIKKLDDLSTFKKAIQDMVAKSEGSWNESFGYSFRSHRLKEYTREEVERIVNSSSL